jgi:chitinase
MREFCCAAKEAKRWKNCSWRGKPGNCFDNHCATGHQVQLAESATGDGKDCGAQASRTRVYCCDPADNKSPFLPVPLSYLFPNPPDEATADTEFKLRLDKTRGKGGSRSQSEDADPNTAAFGFFVLTSPEEVQQTLVKRDGSHWDVFDCFDAVSETEHTVRMVCADDSPASNCHKIHLGHGVPGTILEMPDGCGPGKYAVAVGLAPSRNQSLPHHVLAKRDPAAAPPTVYDLKFDYDFRRVPRDLGDTQLRLDYSNEEGYWDKVVDEAAQGKKRKRSLGHFSGRNHKRWLEDAWREDKHLAGLSAHELHRRWFGDSVISWIRQLLNVAGVKPEVTHSVDETFTAILYRDSIACNVGGVDVRAALNIQADARVRVDTSFGLTLIGKLGLPIDLSGSYVYFRNRGEVTAQFSIDALAGAQFTTGDVELFGLENFGATFRVPGILTAGPNLRLFGSLDGEVSLAGNIRSQVRLADWNIQQTYPNQGSESQPTALSAPSADDSKALGRPTLNYSVQADGHLTAHLRPQITFGIEFGKDGPSCFIFCSDCWVFFFVFFFT